MSTINEIISIANFVAEYHEPVAALYDHVFSEGLNHHERLEEAHGGTYDYTNAADRATDMMWCNP